MKKTLCVSAIKEGTVIDHIQAGQALKIIRLFDLSAQGRCVTVGLNLKSRMLGLKDLIKIEDLLFSEDDAAQIALFSPKATVNVIRNYQVVQKIQVSTPQNATGWLACPNPRCVTNAERIATHFYIEERQELVLLRCKHCEKLFSRDEMRERSVV